MDSLNSLLSRFTNFILSPLASSSPLLLLLSISALFGIAVALAFKWTSNQKKLRQTVDLCRAQILAIKLFKDEPKTIFVSLGRLMQNSLRRVWYLVPSMIAILVPTILLLVQLAPWFEFRPLVVGESTVVELQLADDSWEEYSNLSLQIPSHLESETPSLRDGDQKSIMWRVRVKEPIPTVLKWQLGTDTVEKEFAVTEQPEVLSPTSVRRPSTGFLDRLLHPIETPLEEHSPVRGIKILHPKRATLVFGWDIPWWLTMLLVSMIAAVLVRPIFKVQF